MKIDLIILLLLLKIFKVPILQETGLIDMILLNPYLVYWDCKYYLLLLLIALLIFYLLIAFAHIFRGLLAMEHPLELLTLLC